MQPYAGHVWKHSRYREVDSVWRDSFLAQGFEYQFVNVIPHAEIVIAQLACARGDKAVPKYTSPATNKLAEQVVDAILAGN